MLQNDVPVHSTSLTARPARVLNVLSRFVSLRYMPVKKFTMPSEKTWIVVLEVVQGSKTRYLFHAAPTKDAL